MVTIHTLDPKKVSKEELEKVVGMIASFSYKCPNGLVYPQCVRIDRILDNTNAPPNWYTNSGAIQGQCYHPSIRKWITFSLYKIVGKIHIEIEE